MASITAVADLKPYRSMWRIKVKIIRLWKQYSAGFGESVEMIFVDEKGGKIHATIKKAQIKQFGNQLVEGASRIITNVSVSHATGSYRTCDHVYKIVFLPTTVVRECPPLSDNFNGFSFAKFTDIIEGNLNQDLLIDVVGQVINIGALETISVHGKDTKKIVVELRDSDNERISCSLWSEYADTVVKYMDLTTNVPLICLLRCAKIKVWKDVYSVSNAYSCSQLLMNPDIPEVNSFLATLPEDGLEVQKVENNQIVVVGSRDKDDAFFATPRATIQEILERFVILGTIIAIDKEMGWYYLSCKSCTRKVLAVPVDGEDDNNEDAILPHAYFYPKCKRNVSSIVPMFKLHLIVADASAQTKLMLFDTLATQIVNQQASQLADSNNEIDDPENIPLALTNLQGKSYLFKIGVEKEHTVYKHDTYRVSQIVTDMTRIREFKDYTSDEDLDEATLSLESKENKTPLLLLDSDANICNTPMKKRKLTKHCTGDEGFNVDNYAIKEITQGNEKKVCNVKIKQEKLAKE